MLKFIIGYIAVFAVSGLLYGCGDTISQTGTGNSIAGEDANRSDPRPTIQEEIDAINKAGEVEASSVNIDECVDEGINCPVTS